MPVDPAHVRFGNDGGRREQVSLAVDEEARAHAMDGASRQAASHRGSMCVNLDDSVLGPLVELADFLVHRLQQAGCAREADG